MINRLIFGNFENALESVPNTYSNVYVYIGILWYFFFELMKCLSVKNELAKTLISKIQFYSRTLHRFYAISSRESFRNSNFEFINVSKWIIEIRLGCGSFKTRRMNDQFVEMAKIGKSRFREISVRGIYFFVNLFVHILQSFLNRT